MTIDQSLRYAGIGLLSLCTALPASALENPRPNDGEPGRNPILVGADSNPAITEVSPVRRIQRQTPAFDNEPPQGNAVRSIDGSGNNRADPTIGAAGTALLRVVPADYGDGVASLAGADRPSPRAISNNVNAQTKSIPNSANASDFLWQWGQFLDHDIDLTDGIDPPEAADIPVPTDDSLFDPDGTGTAVIAFNRSVYDPNSGTDVDNPRQQLNEISAWIDASNVYGSDTERALTLRTLDGSGQLKTSDGGLLPFNEDGLPNAGGDSPSLFLAGDVRANEQVALTAMHTLFMREHNRLAQAIAEKEPGLRGDALYQRARKIVGAQMQVITYREYLPLLLGPQALSAYRGYRPNIDGSISNIFSSGPYRYGHSTLSPTLLRLDAEGEPIETGHLALRDAFFAPQRLIDEGGIEPILRGLAGQICQNIDPFVIDDVRNFLFGPPGSGGFDLAALNIQRGRDHGLPSYNTARHAFGLAPAANFADISTDEAVRQRLQGIYDTVDDIDLWVGTLAEDHRPGALVGELAFRVIKSQFEALRDGDRFWYQRVLTRSEIADVEQTQLADIIRRNTEIGDEIGNNVFRTSQTANPRPRSGRRAGNDSANDR